MRILLFILKIIGILLLAILLLAVLLVFYPVFYQIRGTVNEEISLQGRFSWLFRIVQFEIELEDNEIKSGFRILGFRRKPKNEKPEEKTAEKIRKDTATEENQKDTEAEGNGKAAETKENQKDTAAEANRKGTETESQRKEEAELPEESQRNAEEESAASQNDAESSANAHKGTNAQKSAGFIKKVKAQKGKISIWKKNLGGIKKEFTDERNKMAVSHLWQEVLYLLSHLKPKYIRAELDYSIGDPAATGQVTGVLSMFPVMYLRDVHVYPDFLSEEFYIRGDLELKGRMALFHAIRCLVRVWNDKNLKRLFYKIRK